VSTPSLEAWDERRAGPVVVPVGQPATGPSGRVHYARKAIADECRQVRETAEGSRNAQVNTSALKLGRLVAGGHATEDDVRGALLEAAVAVGLPAGEANKAISSGFRAGLRHPRDAGEAHNDGSSLDDAPAGLRDVTDQLGQVAAAAAAGAAAAVATAEPERVDVSAYLHPGGTYLLNVPEHAEPVWGAGDQVVWAKGEALMIAGGAGLGKTTVAGQLVRARMGLQPQVLELPVVQGQRVLWLMMDRPQQIARSAMRLFSRGELEQYGDDRLTIGAGPPPRDLARYPELLAELCASCGADTVVVDSLKDAAVGLTDDEVGAGYNRARQLAITAGVEVLELHHLVKRGQDGKAPTALADVYGSTWLTAGAGSVLLLAGDAGDPIVRALHLKQPQDDVGPLDLAHDHQRGVTTISKRVDLLELLAVTKIQTAESAARQLFSTETPTAAQREKARRRLEKLCEAGQAWSEPGRPGGDGGTTAKRYHPHQLTELAAAEHDDTLEP